MSTLFYSVLVLLIGLLCRVNSDESTRATPHLVIARGGASAHYPENTMAAFKQAIRDGADYIQCSVVRSKDGALFCSDTLELSKLTNIRSHRELKPLFTTLRTFLPHDLTAPPEHKYPGVPAPQPAVKEGYFTFNLTAEQLQHIGLEQRYIWRDHSLHGQLHMVPLPRLLDFLFPSHSPSAPPPPPPSLWERRRADPLAHLSWQSGAVGVLFKLKLPEFHRSINLPLEEPLLDLLSNYSLLPPPTSDLSRPLFDASHPLTPSSAPVLLGTQDVPSLLRLQRNTSLPLVLFLTNLPIVDQINAPCPTGTPYYQCLLEEASAFASMVAVHKQLLAPVDPNTRYLRPNSSFNFPLSPAAHNRSLAVFVYPLNDERDFLPLDYLFDPWLEYQTMYAHLGVDGVVTDFPSTAVRYLKSDKCTVDVATRNLSDVLYFFLLVALATLPMLLVTLFAVHRWRTLERHLSQQSSLYRPVGSWPMTWRQLSEAVNGGGMMEQSQEEEEGEAEPLADPLGSPSSAPPAVQSHKFTTLFSLQSHFDSWTDRVRVNRRMGGRRREEEEEEDE